MREGLQDRAEGEVRGKVHISKWKSKRKFTVCGTYPSSTGWRLAGNALDLQEWLFPKWVCSAREEVSVDITLGRGSHTQEGVLRTQGIVPVCSAAESELTRFSDGLGKHRGTCCRQDFG